MKMKRILALLLASAMIFSVAGCGNSDSSESQTADGQNNTAAEEPAAGQEESTPTETAEGETAQDAEHEPVTLRFMWWGGDERATATLNVIDEFESRYPWITIEAEYGSSDGYQEKLTTQLVSGTAADIIQMGPGWMPGYVESNPDYFVDFKEYGDMIDLSGFEASFLENNGVLTAANMDCLPVFPDMRSFIIPVWQKVSDLISANSILGMIYLRWVKR